MSRPSRKQDRAGACCTRDATRPLPAIQRLGARGAAKTVRFREEAGLIAPAPHPVGDHDGRIEALAMPTDVHQSVLLFLHALFRVWLRPRGGVVMVSGMRMRVREGKFREPDILLLRDRSDPRRQNRCWQGADLVVEVVSPDDPDRDLVEKRADYAEAGIAES